MTLMTDYFRRKNSIRLREITETFQDYKKPSLFLSTCFCDWKCCKEAKKSKKLCQNYNARTTKIVRVEYKDILEYYNNSLITESIVIGGFEPFLQYEEMFGLIKYLRQYIDDDIVIYTGYYPEEILPIVSDEILELKNIIIKYGRYKFDLESRYDKVLGVTLSSKNQFAVKY